MFCSLGRTPLITLKATAKSVVAAESPHRSKPPRTNIEQACRDHVTSKKDHVTSKNTRDGTEKSARAKRAVGKATERKGEHS